MRRNRGTAAALAACLTIGLAVAPAASAKDLGASPDDPYSPTAAAPVRVGEPERLIINDLIGNGDEGLMLDGSYTNFDARTANWIAPAGSLASLRFSPIDTSRAGGYRLSGRAMCVADKPDDRKPRDCGNDRSDIAYVEQTVTEPNGRTLTYRIWDALRAPGRSAEIANLSKIQTPGDLNHDGRYDTADLEPFTVTGYDGFSWNETSYKRPGPVPSKVTATLPNHWHQSYRVDHAADGFPTGVLTIFPPVRDAALTYTFAGTASPEATRSGITVRYRPSSSWRGTPTLRWHGSQDGESIHGSVRMTSMGDGWWRATIPGVRGAALSLTFSSGLRRDTNHWKGYRAAGTLSSVSVSDGKISAIA